MKIEVIKSIVSDFFFVEVSDIEGMCRKRKFAVPRMVAYLMARELTDSSLNQIAAHFSDRDHTSILHGERRASQLIASDDDLAERVEGIRRAIRNALEPVMFRHHANDPFVFRTTRKAA